MKVPDQLLKAVTRHTIELQKLQLRSPLTKQIIKMQKRRKQMQSIRNKELMDSKQKLSNAMHAISNWRYNNGLRLLDWTCRFHPTMDTHELLDLAKTVVTRNS